MKELQAATTGTRRWLVAAGVTLVLTVAMVYLRVAVVPHRVVPLTYALPLLVALWHRDRGLLWGMAGCFMASAVYKIIWLMPDESWDYYGQQLLYAGMQWVNIVLPATVIHLMLNHRERLLRANDALSRANSELETSNEELASRE